MSYFFVVHICALSMNWAQPTLSTERYSSCVEVGMGAIAGGVEPSLAVALAYTESRFNPVAKSSRGAHGPLQIKPVFHCPNKRLKGCNLIKAGIGAIIRYRNRYGSDWLCHWNSGNRCYDKSRLFARIVLRRQRTLRKGR